VALEAPQAHYVRHVLRASMADKLALFNGTDGEWLAEITEISKKNVHAVMMRQLRAQTQTPDITLLLAAIKSARMENAVEQATEIGVKRIVPVRTARTQPAHVNTDRLSAIAREAAEQCERLEWPEIMPYTPLASALAALPPEVTVFYGDESQKSPPMTPLLTQEKPSAWAILVGPEGGFSPEEFALLATWPTAKGVSLGPRILRTGTASLTLAALTLAHFGDWHD
jgi:16S rRNA (uracil1498-N3)-methyltransferase